MTTTRYSPGGAPSPARSVPHWNVPSFSMLPWTATAFPSTVASPMTVPASTGVPSS